MCENNAQHRGRTLQLRMFCTNRIHTASLQAILEQRFCETPRTPTSKGKFKQSLTRSTTTNTPKFTKARTSRGGSSSYMKLSANIPSYASGLRFQGTQTHPALSQAPAAR